MNKETESKECWRSSFYEFGLKTVRRFLNDRAEAQRGRTKKGEARL